MAKAHINDLFVVFQEFFLQAKAMQKNWPVASWDVMLQQQRKQVQDHLTELGLGDAIDFEPRDHRIPTVRKTVG